MCSRQGDGILEWTTAAVVAAVDVVVVADFAAAARTARRETPVRA